ncbi:hypothetical protein K458DRAFT_423838 [Lentithecium fluviatile CBS 122367]|uniref:RING-type domain-containing protein n=1 Tax=Lentithecium fluviatile CBS 122367 TaxID=1168545 RepID=A0A6G1IHX4_9PLEO|nr:hypothetical protein K458DRAFT_423838 [Lentithecium fluviatile CBS 122367]
MARIAPVQPILTTAHQVLIHNPLLPTSKPLSPAYQTFGDFLRKGLRCPPSHFHSDEECSICFEPYNPFHPPVHIAHCGHNFHRRCVTTWEIVHCFSVDTTIGVQEFDEWEFSDLLENDWSDQIPKVLKQVNETGLDTRWAEYDEGRVQATIWENRTTFPVCPYHKLWRAYRSKRSHHPSEP